MDKSFDKIIGIDPEIKAPVCNDETAAALQEAENIAKNGPFRFNSAEEMFNDLGI